MRQALGFYFIALLAQYAFNPFVPGPKVRVPERFALASLSVPHNPDRKPASAGAPLFRDRHGLIVQANGDGGDTAQRTGMYYFIQDEPQIFEKEFALALDLLEVEPGIYVRHPYQGGFRSDPRRFSRDQQTPLIIALGKYRMHDRLFRLLKRHVLRLGKYQNLDFIGPVQIGQYIRAFNCRPLYPLLFVTDYGLLFSTFEVLVSTSESPDSVDDNNHILSLLQAKEVMPTPVSWLARKIYKTKRPPNYGMTVLGEKSPVQGALSWYHRFESGGSPAISEAYRRAVEEM